MVIIGILGVFMIRYGPKIKYIACTFLFSAWGLYMTVRQSVIFWPLDVGQGHAGAIFGVHTNTWAVFVFWVCVLFMGAMMFFITKKSVLMENMLSPTDVPKPFTKYAKFVVALSTFVVASNCFQALVSDGWPPYDGKEYPDRFSLNLEMMHKTWTPRIWNKFNNIDWIGPEVVDEPYIAGVSMPKDVVITQPFSEGPIATPAGVAAAGTTELLNPATLGIKENEAITGIAYNPETGEYGVVTNNLAGFYVDRYLANSTGHARFDKPNGPDVKYVIGGGFAGNKLMILGSNKTLVGIEKTDEPIDPVFQWKVFRDTTGGIAPVTGRSRINMRTVRAKWAHVDALAIGDGNLYAISVPNKTSKKAVLLRFSTKDWQITGEFPLEASPDLQLKPNRNVSDYYVTGLAWKDGKLYAISPRYHSLLVVDPNNGQVEKVYELSGLIEPRSAFFKDEELYVLDYNNGKNSVTQVNIPS